MEFKVELRKEEVKPYVGDCFRVVNNPYKQSVYMRIQDSDGMNAMKSNEEWTKSMGVIYYVELRSGIIDFVSLKERIVLLKPKDPIIFVPKD